MAGFRNGRGRGQAPRPAQQSGGYPPHPGAPGGEPEYYGAPDPYPRYDDAPGSTRAFTLPDGPGYGPGNGPGYPDDDAVATYRAGQSTAPPAGPRLRGKELIAGILLRPGRTFWQMRDYPVWGPALLVTFVYGLLAVFGFDTARSDVLSSNLSASIPWVLITAVAVVISGLTMGAVTHALARQFGGDGAWAPTIGLAMLITSLTDAPRLLLALFLGNTNGVVQIVGWATWVAAGALLTSMVGKSHDLPWTRALGASAIQLAGLLVLFKLPTL